MTIKIKFDIDIMKFISMFEKITKVHPKDCFKKDSKITFIVNEGKIGLAVGKKGMNIRKMETMFKKKIKIIEYSSDMIQFIQNVIYPLKAADMEEKEGIITITPIDNKTRGYLIGREAVNLRGFENIVKRYFEIKEIKVV